MAKAKGLHDRRVMTRYAARNAILPPLNGFAAAVRDAPSAASSSSSSSSAIPAPDGRSSRRRSAADYPLTQGLLLVFAVCVIVANFIMDMLNFVLDPRVRTA